MSNINWGTHTVSNNNTAENKNNNSSRSTDIQTRRVVHTAGRSSFSGTTSRTTLSCSGGGGDSDQSFAERGQIVSRHHRRVTLSPSPDDESGQEFGWGTTLFSTLHHHHDDDDDANVDNYFYNNDNNNARREGPSVELSPPARHPHRSLSDDRRSTWGRAHRGATNMVLTTTITTTNNKNNYSTSIEGIGGSSSDRTVRYEPPHVLGWHQVESTTSPVVSQGSPMIQSLTSQQSTAPHQARDTTSSTTGTRDMATAAETASKGRGSMDDENMIKEVVRTIHASRTGPFPGLSHGHGHDDIISGSSYDEDPLLSGQGLGRTSSRIPRLNANPNKPLAINNSRSQQKSTTTTTDRATNRQSHETNRDTFGSRQMSFGQLSIANAGGESAHESPSVEHVEQQQQRTRPVPHLPRPIITDEGATSHPTQTNNNNNNRQDAHHGERAVRRTSITRIPGPNLVDVTKRASEGKTLDNRRLSISRNNSHNEDRTTELGGGRQGGFLASSTNNTNRQDVQNQSNGLPQSTSPPMVDNTGIRDPRKTHAGAAARYAGLSKIGGAAAHGNESTAEAKQGFGETTQSRMEGDISNQQTTRTTGGRGATGILAAAHAASGGDNQNHPALNDSDYNAATSPRDFAVANTATITSSGDDKTSNTQVRPAAGSTSSSSPNSLPAQHHRDNDNTAAAARVPPALTHHGQHATFTNLPEPEKAHYNQNRGLGYRFREASLSTVGSIFKPEQRRQSSVTVMGDGSEPQPATDERYRDEAWDFLRRYRTERIVDVGRQPSCLRRLRRRIDLHLMVFLFFAYLVTFLDKILFNVSLPFPLSKVEEHQQPAGPQLTSRFIHSTPESWASSPNSTSLPTILPTPRPILTSPPLHFPCPMSGSSPKCPWPSFSPST